VFCLFGVRVDILNGFLNLGKKSFLFLSRAVFKFFLWLNERRGGLVMIMFSGDLDEVGMDIGGDSLFLAV